MSYGDLRPFATKDALQLLNCSRGGAYFIPEGYEPILVAHEELTDEVRTEIRRSTAHMRVPTALHECRLPSYIVSSRKCAGRLQETSSNEKNPPRPPNAFILYRKSKQAEIVSVHRGISNNDVSRIIGQMWKSENEEVKEEYQRAAETIKIEHRLQYPNYRYRPRKQSPKRSVTPLELADNTSIVQEDPAPLRLQPYPVYRNHNMKPIPTQILSTSAGPGATTANFMYPY